MFLLELISIKEIIKKKNWNKLNLSQLLSQKKMFNYILKIIRVLVKEEISNLLISMNLETLYNKVMKKNYKLSSKTTIM